VGAQKRRSTRHFAAFMPQLPGWHDVHAEFGRITQVWADSVAHLR
jgi:hypothetical protein